MIRFIKFCAWFLIGGVLISAHAEDRTIFRIVAQKVLNDQTRIRMVMSFDAVHHKWLELGFAEVGDNFEKILEPTIEFEKWEKDSAMVFVKLSPKRTLRMIATVKPENSGDGKLYDSLFLQEAKKSLSYYDEKMTPESSDYALSTWMSLSELRQNQWVSSRYFADPLDLELFSQSWSTLVAQTQPEPKSPAPKTISAPLVVGETIRRWRAEFAKPSGLWMDSALFLVTIYHPDGDDAALMEFSSRQSHVHTDRGALNMRLTMEDVDHFSVVRAYNPHALMAERAFKIKIKQKPAKSGAQDYLAPRTLYAFKDGTVMVNDNAWVGWQDVDQPKLFTKSLVDESPSSVFKFFDNVPSLPLVFEQYTVSPVEADAYFGPRGVKLQYPDPGVVWFSSRWADATPAAEIRPPAPEGLRPLVLTGRLQGRDQAVEEVLAQIDKPTIQQFLALIEGPPKPDEANPFSAYIGLPLELRDGLKKNLPGFIFRLETAFPGATWYGLGRDIFLLTDALTAFYTFVGQPERVVRVPASAASFQNSTREDVLAFLKPYGIDPRTIRDGPPKIFFDITSYGARGRTSQSNRIMRAIYHELDPGDVSRQTLLRQVNFVSTGYDGKTLFPADNPQEIEAYFNTVEALETGPERILRFDMARNLQYTDAWHGIYQAFTKDAEGRVISPPGSPNARSTKLKLLGELWEVCQTVMNKTFVRGVNRRFLENPTEPKKFCAKALEANPR